MRHKKKNRPLGRHRVRYKALEIMGAELIRHESIISTHTKATELKKYIEPIITLAKKKETLANRRSLVSRLKDKEIVDELYEQAKKIKRQSGFVRLTKLPQKRQDGAQMTRIELLD